MIFVNPEYVVLLHQVNQKKDELTDKIVEKDRLLAFVCRELKMNYMLKIGSLEYKKMLIENDIKKTERKIEIVKKLKIVTEKTEVRVEEKIRKEFSEETKREIVDYSKSLYDKTSAQIVVVTVDTVGDSDIESYATDLFRSFGIGDKDKNNGL